MSFVSKVTRITAAVFTLGGSEISGISPGIAAAKKRSNNKHQANVVADGILQAQGIKSKKGKPVGTSQEEAR